MSEKCYRCGAVSEIPGVFVKVHRSFRSGLFDCCPPCQAKSQQSRYRRMFLFIFVRAGLGLLLGFAIKGPVESLGWFFLNWFLLDLFYLPLIWLHELGHAWAGRALGLRIFKINLGKGRVVLTRRLFGVETVFHAIPLGGDAWGALQHESWARAREFGFILGGPAVHLLFAASVLLFIPIGDLWQLEPFRHGFAPVHVFFYANAFLLLGSLLPRGAEKASRTQISDGNLLCETLFKKPTAEAVEVARCDMESRYWMEAGKHAEALPWLERGLSRSPANLNFLNYRAHCLYELGRREESRSTLLEMLAREDLPPSARPSLLNGVAYTDAILGGQELLPEADRYSLESMDALGWDPAVKGTRGAVLVLLGRMLEGMPLLVESLEQTDSVSGQAENHCWLAMGHWRLGELAEARKHVEEARRLQPDCFLLERAERASESVISKQ